MPWSWETLFWAAPIGPATINNVPISPHLRTALFAIIVGSYAISLGVLIVRKQPALAALRRAAVISFFLSGMFYAVYGQSVWVRWVQADIGTFGGLTTEQKLRVMDGGLYDMAQRAKPLLGGDYMRSQGSDVYLRQKFRFYVLPARLSDDAPVVVVLNDPAAHLDPQSGTLTIDGKTFENVEPLLLYAQNAYLVRRK